MTMRPQILLGFALLLGGNLGAETSSPNFVIVYVDDLGYGDVSMHGSSEVLTPHIDRIAHEGMQFSGMRANCTVCSPSRAALLTGRYADRVGVPGVIRTSPANSWGFLAPGIPTLADELRNAGYQTAIIGKWRLGLALQYAQNNDPWHGGKQEHYDGGLRVPFAVRWPREILAGSQSDYQGLVFDLFPTVLELAGAKTPAGIDAVSLVPLLRGGELANSRELYFVRREGGRRYGGKSYEAIIHDGWKLLQNDPFSPLELYHVEKDPEEKVDLASSNPPKLGELTDRLRKHIQRGGEVPWSSPRPEGKEPNH